MRRFVLSILSLMLVLYALVAAKPKTQPPARLGPMSCLRVRPDPPRHVQLRPAASDVPGRGRAHALLLRGEEGVTVYHFDNGQYVKKEFMRGSTLVKALKKYAK